MYKCKIFCRMGLHKWHIQQSWIFRFDKDNKKQLKTYKEQKTCKRCWNKTVTEKLYYYDEQLKSWIQYE